MFDPTAQLPDDGDRRPNIRVQPLNTVPRFEDRDDGVMLIFSNGQGGVSFALNDETALELSKAIDQVLQVNEEAREEAARQQNNNEGESKCPFGFNKPF